MTKRRVRTLARQTELKIKKIVIDDGLSRLRGATGIGNYSNLLYESLQDYIAKSGDNIEVIYKDYSFLSLLPSKSRRLLYLLLINSFGLMTKADIFHFTNYYMPIVKPKGLKYIVTIHDMAAWAFTRTFSLNYLRFIRPFIKRAISISDIIITVSQTVKDEISSTFNISGDKIYVCHNAVRPIFKPLDNFKKGRYLLFVGIIAPQKNLPSLINAFAKLIKDPKHKDLMLIIIGKKWTGFKELEYAIRKESIEEHVSIKGYVDDKEMVRLYNGAEALVMPSLYEGFGIPIIEAMACRIPVIASDIPVFREVAGDAALFYGPPEDENMLCKAMDKILSSESFKHELISKGDKQVLRYSWENVAKDHMAAYNMVKDK